MASCEPCRNLVEQAPPHGDLELLKKGKYGYNPMGASGYIYSYRCRVCGSEMTFDGDTKDPYAGWARMREGNLPT